MTTHVRLIGMAMAMAMGMPVDAQAYTTMERRPGKHSVSSFSDGVDHRSPVPAQKHDQGPYRAVVKILQNGAFICTGAVIAPPLILSAAHCVMDRDPRSPGQRWHLAAWRSRFMTDLGTPSSLPTWLQDTDRGAPRSPGILCCLKPLSQLGTRRVSSASLTTGKRIT